MYFLAEAPNLKPSVESLSVAARLLGYAAEPGADIEVAFDKAISAADVEQQRALQQLRALVGGTSSVNGPAASDGQGGGTLAWLFTRLPPDAHTVQRLVGEWQRSRASAASAASMLTSRLVGLLSYLCLVLAILALISAFYAVIVMPNFASLYEGFGRGLPGLTSLMFGSGRFVVLLVILILGAPVVLALMFVMQLRRRLRRLEPVSASRRRIPVLGLVVRAYNQWLWLEYVGILMAGGMAAAPALRTAAERVPAEMSPAPRQQDIGGASPATGSAAAALSAADRLGKLDAEIQFQREAALETFLAAMDRSRFVLRIVLTLCVYLLVGLTVSAMYEPIFSLGEGI